MINKNASPEMRTAADDVDAASHNVPRHILCYVTNNKSHEGIPPPNKQWSKGSAKKEKEKRYG